MPKRKPPARRRYDTDLTDAQWELIAPLTPEARADGRPRKASARELVNAIFYFLRGGVTWRLLPHYLPLWQTVYHYLRRWQREGVWQHLLDALVLADREQRGRAAATLRPRRRSSTVRQSALPIKRGRQRLRRGQEDQRAQAPHPNRHRRPAARGARAWCRRAGSRRPQAAAKGIAPTRSPGAALSSVSVTSSTPCGTPNDQFVGASLRVLL